VPKITTEQTVEVKLAPTLKKKLSAKLKAFTANKAQMDALEYANRKIKDEIEALFVDAGEFGALQEGVKAEGCSVKHISPVRTRLDKKLLVQQGVTTAQIQEATKTTPGKAYLKINTPGEKEPDEEQD